MIIRASAILSLVFQSNSSGRLLTSAAIPHVCLFRLENGPTSLKYCVLLFGAVQLAQVIPEGLTHYKIWKYNQSTSKAHAKVRGGGGGGCCRAEGAHASAGPEPVGQQFQQLHVMQAQ